MGSTLNISNNLKLPLSRTSAIDYLAPTYLKVEPRNTANWIDMIKAMSQRLVAGQNTNWQDLIPDIDTDLLVDYINDPRGVIKEDRLSPEEIEKLRQPQRVMLFYFLKKLSSFDVQNEQIVTNINNLLARELFSEKSAEKVADEGIAVFTEPNLTIDIPKGTLLDAIVESEVPIREYEIPFKLLATTVSLDKLLMGRPVIDNNRLRILELSLPLTEAITPFLPVHRSNNQYRPSLILKSPLLRLGEGKRTISLLLVVEDLEASQKVIDDPFNFEATTAEGWVPLNQYCEISGITNQHTYQYTFVLATEEPALAPLTPADEEEETETETANLEDSWGAMKITGKPGVSTFRVVNIDYHVQVDGLLPTVIRNQEMVLDPTDNFQPFGPEAPVGATFSFSHIELTERPIEDFWLQPAWVGQPDDIDKYYKAYPRTKKDLTVNVNRLVLSENRANHTADPLGKNVPVFETRLGGSLAEASPFPQTTWVPDEPDPLMQPLCYQLTLSGKDFGHAEYPLLMANYTVALANQKPPGFFKKLWHWIRRKKILGPLPVNMPYTPGLEQSLMGYKSQNVSWSTENKSPFLDVHLTTPQGFQVYCGEGIDLGEDQHGALYFGFEQFTPNRPASIYIDGLPGVPPDIPLSIDWKYLSKTGWMRITEEDLLFDGTYGLTQSGIFYWNIATDASSTSTAMPKGYLWLKAIPREADSGYEYPVNRGAFINGIRGIFANAFPIRRLLNDEIIGSDLSLIPKDSQVFIQGDFSDLSIRLPIDTYGSIPAENNMQFWDRTFNNVRNRKRAVISMGYEQLILNKFRHIDEVKCLQRKAYKAWLQVVVVGKVSLLDPEDTTQDPSGLIPVVPDQTLKNIHEWLISYVSPFFKNPMIGCPLSIRITNPRYVPVGLLVYVSFTYGASEGENRLRVQIFLKQYINMWLFDKNTPLQFGQWFKVASLISHLKQLPFIKDVYDVRLFRREGTKVNFSPRFAPDEVMVLTDEGSVVITLDPEESLHDGIGRMAVDLDLYVNDNP